MKKYSYEKAAKFWSNRAKSTDPLAAVLTFHAPKVLNEIYDRWEKESLKSALPHHLKREKALDLGCGTGRIALTLAQLKAEVTAVDISNAMLSHLKKKACRDKLLNRVSLVRSSSAQLPFDKQSFDIITCFGLLEHLPEAVRRKTVFETFRVLKPNGKMFAVVNNADCIFLQKNYPMTSQKRDGYFVTLVGLKWLEKVCRVNRLEVKIIAANPMYALNHYFVSADRKSFFGSEQIFEWYCRNSTRYDFSETLDNNGLQRLASHFMVEIT